MVGEKAEFPGWKSWICRL